MFCAATSNKTMSLYEAKKHPLRLHIIKRGVEFFGKDHDRMRLSRREMRVMKKLLILAAVLILTTSAGCCQSGCCGWCRKGARSPAQRPASLLACRAARVSRPRAWRPRRSSALKCTVRRPVEPAGASVHPRHVPPGQGSRRWLTTAQSQPIAVGRAILKAANRDGFRPMIPGLRMGVFHGLPRLRRASRSAWSAARGPWQGRNQCSHIHPPDPVPWT